MKILHIAPSISRAYGGPTYSLAAFATAALEQGAELTIAAPKAPEADDWLASSLAGAEVHEFHTFGGGAFLASPALHRWLRANGSRFDAVHVHGLLNPVSSLATRACVRKGWPVVVRPFGTMSRYTFAHRRGAIKQLYRALLDKPNLMRASAMHFTTSVERDESAWQRIGWGARAFVIPPPWIELPPAPGTKAPADSRMVLFFSRLHPVKRLELLIDAWPDIHTQSPDATLVIAGSGEVQYVRELRARAARLGAQVTFTGFVEGEQKAELLRNAAVFVLPSLHENFGIAVLEALAAGLPAVITPQVQLSEFVRTQALGIITEPSVSALSRSVVAALDDTVLRKRCRTQGAALVSRYFSSPAIGEQLLEMYRFANAHPPP